MQFVHDIISNLDVARNFGTYADRFDNPGCCKGIDKALHSRLLHKRDYNALRGYTHNKISLWLCERSQQVVLNGQTSDTIPFYGVALGSVLGQIFFLSS